MQLMKTNLTPNKIVFCLLSVVLLTLACLVGCDEKDVPYVIDEDEISRYVNENGVGQEVFRYDSLIVSGVYSTPLDNAVYYDTVLSHQREISVVISDSEADYDNLGMLKEAIANVLDIYQMRTLRIDGTDTSTYEHERLISRIGFFLKMGDDSQAYVGWLLWGLGSPAEYAPPARVTVTPSSSTPYPGDPALFTLEPKVLSGIKYVRLSDIPQLSDGVRLIVQTQLRNAVQPYRYYQHISAAGQNGFFTRPMHQVSETEYVDTVQTPTNNPRLYNVVLMQSFRDDTLAFSGAWVFPYRIPQ